MCMTVCLIAGLLQSRPSTFAAWLINVMIVVFWVKLFWKKAAQMLLPFATILGAITLLCLSIALPVSAQVNASSAHYFSATVPVKSQSASDRRVALNKALAEVLVKVSGHLDMPVTQPGAKALANAGRYVQQFRYMRAEEVTGQEEQLLLKADFDRSLVQGLIKSSDKGLWPTNRPEVLLWAIEHTPDQGRAVITDPQHPLIVALMDRAAQRGLPVLLPLWDLDDQIALSDDQLWRLNSQAIAAASARYDVNTVLTARYSQTSELEWLASWQFQHGDEVMQYDLSTTVDAELAVAGIDPAVNYLAERYAVYAANDESEFLQVMELQGVYDYLNYQEALAYVQRQPLISNAKLMAVKGDTLVFHIMLTGDWNQLNNALALDRKMQSLNDNLSILELAALGAPDVPALYRWQAR